jgi:hypothetical protein
MNPKSKTSIALALALAGVFGYSSAVANDSTSYSPSSAIATGTNNAVITKSYNLTLKAPSNLNDKGMGDLTGNVVLKPTGQVQWPANTPGVLVDVTASVMPEAGVLPATAMSWLSVSDNSWNCMSLSEEKTISVALNVPAGAPAGSYVYTISAKSQNDGLGWGGGAHTLTVIVDEFVPAVIGATFVLDESAPLVNITKPTSSTFTYASGGTAIPVQFDAAEVESPITSMVAAVGTAPVTITATGLPGTSASATGTATVTGIGTYTLTAKAYNTRAVAPGDTTTPTFLEGSATKDFTVNYDMNGCWLPPLSLGKVSKGGSTIPLKFTAKDADGLFIYDNTVQVKISRVAVNGQVSANDVLITTGTFGAGSGSVGIQQIDAYTGQYHVNFASPAGAHTYRMDVFFQGIQQASKEFSTKL